MLKGLNERHHGNLSDAVVLLRSAANNARTSTLPHLLLGHVLEQSGDHSKALDAYAAALRIDPGNEDAQALWAQGQPQLLAAPTDQQRNE